MGRTSIRRDFSGLPPIGMAACAAESLTIAFDTAKVRSQLTKGNAKVSVLATMRAEVANHGFQTLFVGMAAGWQRQLVFATLRTGLYTPVRNGLATAMGRDPTEANLFDMVLAASTTGSLAMLIAQPTDVIKVAMQQNNPQYTRVRDAWRGIFMTNGIRGLWKGLTPNVLRNAAVNTGEMVTYDLVKKALVRLDVEQGPVLHACAAATAGFIAATVSNPVDLIKTRMQVDPSIKNPITCARDIYKSEGGRSFYKGYGASIVRIASWNVLYFVTLEHVLSLLNLDALAK